MNTGKYSISAIIPMYNEEANVKPITRFAIQTLSGITDSWEIIIIESGSTDKTREIIEEETKKDHRILAFFQERREGMGSALRLGYAKATKELIWHLESDAPFDLYNVKKALAFLEDYDGVIGYRTSSKAEPLFGWVYSKHNKMESFIRGVFHIGYNLLIRIFFGLKVKDVNFSFKIFKSELIKKLKLFSSGWFIDAEILLETKKAKGKIKEIGIEYKQREYGNSTVGILSPINIVSEMFAYYFSRWKNGDSKP